MSQAIRPIETRYNGYRFRSRLEARWAVFFDTLGCSWEYEREGFDLGSDGFYLPDFWLTTVSMWAEVKPEDLTGREYAKCAALVQATESPCILLVGTPTINPYEVIFPCNRVYCAEPCSGRETHLLDLLLTEEYLFSERRFFLCPNGDAQPGWPGQEKAVAAARSARFEFGESGR